MPPLCCELDLDPRAKPLFFMPLSPAKLLSGLEVRLNGKLIFLECEKKKKKALGLVPSHEKKIVTELQIK